VPAGFPIDAVLPAVRTALARAPNLVVQAPPGAGKTTRLPLALLDDPQTAAWLGSRKLVMLEPRRLAARAAARFMARTLGEEPGGTVGYRVRLDTRVGPRTRLEVVTEGVLTRLLQDDPALSAYGAVIFDEFHERSIHADLGLALTLESQRALRPDLRLIVMSATLDGARVAALLTDGSGATTAATIVTSEGRAFPVETRFAPPPPAMAGARGGPPRIEGHLAAMVLRALREEPGSVLAFLPGQAEIGRVVAALTGQLPKDCELTPLFGDMEGAAQDAAIRPASPGRRKVVLATAIAETSLTIEGVRVVVDSGLSRIPRFDVASGMGRLETVRVSRASADQRRGRAGRTEPGVCYRLWSEGEDQRLNPHSVPEVLEADLVPLALELASWGARDARALAWLDAPKEASLAQARELLVELGALEPAADGSGAITAHGRALLKVPLHPRLAQLCLRGRELGLGTVACELAALLSDRDPIRAARDAPDADLRLRVAALRDRSMPGHPLPPGARVDEGRRQQARQLARDLQRRISTGQGVERNDDPADLDAAGLLVALAYPDRIAQARGASGAGGGARKAYRMRNGRGAHFAHADALARQDWLAIAELDGAGADARIYLAAPLELAAIERAFGDQVESREVGGWDDAAGAVVARRERRLGALVLESRERRDLAPERVVEGLIAGIRVRGLSVLPWSEGALSFRQRVALLRRVDGAALEEGAANPWPDLSDETLLTTLEDWLAPYLAGRSRLAHLADVPLGDALRGLLDHKRQRELEAQAPTHWTVPSGSVKPIDYATDGPVLAVRLQEMFGAIDTPKVARGRVPVTLQLLSPAGRPVQVTKDLAGFWKSAYFDVRKDLRGRYPKHHWPEDPLSAPPTARAKRRTR